MEAKDTVMKGGDWEVINRKAGVDVLDIVVNLDNRYTPVQQAELIVKRCELTAKHQAEISFKAGYKKALEGAVIEGGYESVKKAGIREVVEWVEKALLCHPDYRKQLIKEWQAQLKEWGIDEDKNRQT